MRFDASPAVQQLVKKDDSDWSEDDYVWGCEDGGEIEVYC